MPNLEVFLSNYEEPEKHKRKEVEANSWGS
jgi:hypothetical protein